MHCDHSGTVLCEKDCPLARCLRLGEPAASNIYLHHKLGHRVHVEVRVIPVRDVHGAILGAAEIFDFHDPPPALQHLQGTLAAYGCLDLVTTLPNRAYSETHLRSVFAQFVEHRLPFGIAFTRVVDLEQFEVAHSREARDEMLQVITRTLVHVAGPTAFAGRWDETQFLTVLPGGTAIGMERLAHKILGVLNRSAVQWWGDQLSVTVAVGWVGCEAGDTLEWLLERALQMRLHGAVAGDVVPGEPPVTE
jgi:GGDEF domain-containing protein